MPNLLSFFHQLFHSNQPLTIAEESYIDDYVDDVLARPTPFVANSVARAESHHHVVRIYDFMHNDYHLNPWIARESHEQVLNDPRFSLNNLIITYQ